MYRIPKARFYSTYTLYSIYVYRYNQKLTCFYRNSNSSAFVYLRSPVFWITFTLFTYFISLVSRFLYICILYHMVSLLFWSSSSIWSFLCLCLLLVVLILQFLIRFCLLADSVIVFYLASQGSHIEMRNPRGEIKWLCRNSCTRDSTINLNMHYILQRCTGDHYYAVRGYSKVR